MGEREQLKEVIEGKTNKPAPSAAQGTQVIGRRTNRRTSGKYPQKPRRGR